MMNKRSWLEIAEYISLVGSVVGSAVAVASQQLVYAAVPVSASLVLNMASRRRLEDEKPGTNAISELDRQLSRDVQSVREQVQALRTDSDLSIVQGAIAELQTQLQKRLGQSQEINLTPVHKEISQLHDRYSHLQETLGRLQNRLDSVPPPATQPQELPALEELRIGLAQLKGDAHNWVAKSELTSSLEQLQRRYHELEQAGVPYAEEIGTQTRKLDAISEQVQQLVAQMSQLAAVPQLEEELRTRLAQVRGDAQNLVAKSEFTAVASSLQQLQWRYHELEQAGVPYAEAIGGLTSKLDAINEQVKQLVGQMLQLASVPQLEELRTQQAEQMQIIGVLQQRLERIPASGEPVDLTGVEEVLAKIADSVGEVVAEMDRRIAPLEAIDLNPLRDEIDLQKKAMAFLREQYSFLRQSTLRASDRPASQPVEASQTHLENLESALASATQGVAQLQQRIDTLPTAAIPALEQQIRLLHQRLHSLEEPFLEQLEELKNTSAEREHSAENLATKTEVEAQLATVRKLITEFRESTDTSITEIQRQLAEEIPTLRQQVQSLAPGIQETVTNELLARLESLSEEYQRRPERRQLTALREAYDELTRRIDGLLSPTVSDTRSSVEESLRSLSEGLAELRGQLNGLSEQFQQRPEKAKIRALREAIDQINERLAQVSAPTEPVDLTVVQEEIAEVSEQLDNLSEHFNHRFYRELGSLRKAIEQINQRIDELPASAEPVDLSALEAEISGFTKQLNALNEQFNRRPEAEQVAQLREVVGELNRRIDELPAAPEPVDLSGVQGTVAQLWEGLAQVQRRIDELPTAPEAVDLSSFQATITELSAGLAQVQRRIDELPVPPEPIDLTRVEEALVAFQADVSSLREDRTPVTEADLEAIRREVSQLQQSLGSVSDRLENLPSVASPAKVESLEGALAQLQKQIENLANQFSSAPVSDQTQIEQLTQQLKALASRNDLSSVVADDAHLQELIAEAVHRQLGEINQQLQVIQPHEYQLVFDRPAIRAVLEEAIVNTQHRLIIVCPWLSRSSVDFTLIEKLEALLQRNGQIDIGWGHMRDIEAGEFPIRINQQWQIGPMASTSLYDALNDLEQLKRKYPNQLRLKVLGTHENFLVSDTASAMLSSHHFLSSGNGFPEREVGLRTTDPRIIQALVDRFNEPVLNPSSPSVYYNRGFERLDIGDYHGAVEDYSLALQLNPNQPTAYNNRGLAKYHLGDPRGAIDDYSRSLELNPNEPVVYINRGVARFNQGDYHGSIQDYTQALSLSGEQTGVYFYRGEAYAKLGDFKRAIEDYTQAIRLAPTDAVNYNNRGLARYNEEDYHGAIEDYTQALALDPDDAVALSNRGVARSAISDYDAAFQDFDRALSLNPDYAGAYNNRGLARSQVGDAEGAIADFQKAADLFLAFGDAVNHQQALDALRKLSNG